MHRQESYRLGMAAFNAGQYDRAIEQLTPLASDGTDRQQQLLCRYYLGQAHYRQGVRRFEEQRFTEATRHFQAAASFNASGGGFARFLIACHVGTRRFDLAARELETMLRQEPTSVDLRIKLALTLHKQGRRMDAITTLREGLCQQTNQAELHYQLGVMLAADDDLSEAERCFEKAILFDESHAGAHERLAQICAVTGRYDRLGMYLQKAHELDPFNARVAFQMSLLNQTSLATGQSPDFSLNVPEDVPELDQHAIERLGRIIIQEPDFVEAFLSLPESDIDAEVFSTLAATLELTLESHPEFADLHYHCGAVYRRLGRRLDAIEHTERAVEINPQYVTALVQLAELYAQTDQWAMGVERLEQAIAAGGDYPDVHLLLGKLYQTGGRIDHARKAFQRALALNRDYAEARESLNALAF